MYIVGFRCWYKFEPFVQDVFSVFGIRYSVRSLCPKLTIRSVVWSMCLIRLCSSFLCLFLLCLFDFLLLFLLLMPTTFLRHCILSV